MGKFADVFEAKLADLTADVETKIGVLFMKNPKLENVEFSKPYAGLIIFTAKRVQDNGRYYIQLSDNNHNTSDMRDAFEIHQMIAFLEEIEEFLEEN